MVAAFFASPSFRFRGFGSGSYIYSRQIRRRGMFRPGTGRFSRQDRHKKAANKKSPFARAK
jgi:hypothetical protein